MVYFITDLSNCLNPVGELNSNSSRLEISTIHQIICNLKRLYKHKKKIKGCMRNECFKVCEVV